MECTIKLSVLICHLEVREESFQYLLSILEPQCNGKPVEILHETDNGEMPVGAKRNVLLHRAKGEYIVFVDDDDMVEYDYIDQILEAIVDSPDCVGLNGWLDIKDRGRYPFHHSIQYAGWYAAGLDFFRTPNHLNPVKRELALQVMFNDEMRFGEDADYSERLRPLLFTEKEIEKPIYLYQATERKPDSE